MPNMERTRKFQPRRLMGRLRAYFSKPANVILLIFLVALCLLTLYPLLTMLLETVTVHAGREARAVKSLGLTTGDYTLYHFKKLLFTLNDGGDAGVKLSNSWIQFYGPFFNTLAVSLTSSFIAILFGGTVAFLITRTNIKYKKFVSAVFVFPYIMPSWTLALFWQTFWKNVNIGTGTSNGIMAAVFGIYAPEWLVYGYFPISLVLGLHYAPFAYILIGGILRNMDANLEEAATILKTPRWRIISRITMPIVKPAMLSTFLLVFASSMSAYAVPVFLGSPVRYYVLSTKMKSLMDTYSGQAYIIAAVMIIFGVAILMLNQRVTNSRKQFTTVTLDFKEEEDGRTDYDIIVKGNIQGADSKTLEPKEGPFKCIPETAPERGYQFRVPRQKDNSLTAELWSEGALVDTIPVGELIEKAHFDWRRESLGDIHIMADLPAKTFTITVMEWEGPVIFEVTI